MTGFTKLRMTRCPNSRSAKNVAKGETPEAPPSLVLETTNEHALLTRAIARKALPSVVNRIGTAPHETIRTIRAHRTTPPTRKKIKKPKRIPKKEKRTHGTLCNRALLRLFSFCDLISHPSMRPLSMSSVRSSFLNLFLNGFVQVRAAS